MMVYQNFSTPRRALRGGGNQSPSPSPSPQAPFRRDK